ncbi:MAG: MarC family protein, partial [Lentisphaerota bacterium]
LDCIIAEGVLVFFALTGMWIFSILGITIPAFQIAGSFVLLMIAFDMLRARRSTVQETVEEKTVGISKDDIAITPLAVPMLAGPGAITTTILLEDKASGFTQTALLYLIILLVCLLSYFILKYSAKGAQWMGPIAMKIMTRLMGLLLASVAVQFFLNAIRDLKW